MSFFIESLILNRLDALTSLEIAKINETVGESDVDGSPTTFRTTQAYVDQLSERLSPWKFAEETKTFNLLDEYKKLYEEGKKLNEKNND